MDGPEDLRRPTRFAPADRATRRGPPDPDPGPDHQLAAEIDEVAARAERVRYRKRGVEPLEPDARIRSLLAPDERLLAVRRDVGLVLSEATDDMPPSDPIQGDLYVTSGRLVHSGRHIRSFELDDVEDTALDGERVQLLLHDGVGIGLDADRPRLLRVQVAAARAARAGLKRRRPRRSQAAAR